MDNKIYSRINIRKGHVFDHSAGKTLCCTKHGYHKPNKTLLSASEMLIRHSAIAEDKRNQGIHRNVYKFCCRKCEALLKDIVDV